jgi:hypothetical protein
MGNKTMLHSLTTTSYNLPESSLRKAYFFHDVCITCYTNHPAILAMLDAMLAMFPEPGELRGEASYYVCCYEDASRFPVQLPRDSMRGDTIRLPTNTKITFYRNHDGTIEYQGYTPMPGSNASALTIMNQGQNLAHTQLEMPEYYQPKFLRRYILQVALAELMQSHRFEPCHAAAITSPGDTEQGALILGASGQGKTTLSLGCASRGECGLLGDDLVMLRENDMDRSISAYAITQEVSVRAGTIDLLQSLSFLWAFQADYHGKRYCSIEQVRPGATRIHTPIRLLLFPSLTDEKESRVIPLSKARTLQQLILQCVSKTHTYPHAQERLFLLLNTLVEQAPGYQLALARSANDGPQIVRSLFRGGSR